MNNVIIKPSTTNFLLQLKNNNNREWFNSHKKDYDSAKQNFINLIGNIINELKKSDATIQDVQPKECIFRINKDIRFSKDKSPYKENFGAFISFEGKKTIHAGYYFHLEAKNCFVAGGIYMPPSEVVHKIRKHIFLNPNDFLRIIQNKEFNEYYSSFGFNDKITLKKIPKGFELADKSVMPYLKLKSFTVSSEINSYINKSEIVAEIIKRFNILQPLIHFFNKAVLNT